MTQLACGKWLDSLTWQIDFYHRSGRARRTDPEFDWQAYEHGTGGRLLETRRLVKSLLFRLGLLQRPSLNSAWLREHAEQLWDSRQLLADDLSRLLFDQALVLRLTSHRRFYFPRIDFEDLLEIRGRTEFAEADLPRDYLGVLLEKFDVRLKGRWGDRPMQVITRRLQLDLINSYRQYLIQRDGVAVVPLPGEVVYDCGACIGDLSLLFAAMVAPGGQVHLFDPMPLHARFCRLQAKLNPELAGSLYINTLAVAGRTQQGKAVARDDSEIQPGAVTTDEFPSVTLDDYQARIGGRVDFIKMDIEGAELEALDGATRVIREQQPKLAISVYHKPEDLWEIPAKMHRLNPSYRLMFGHHTPILWESVVYAAPSRDAHVSMA